MRSNNLVSVIINCYNGEKYLKQAIDSVYSQTYTNWEIIFWDNASIDDSYKIAATYDSKVKLFKAQENRSLGEARRQAIQKAKGDWLAFLDVDDIWLPKKLQLQLVGLIDGDYLLSYGGIEEVDKDLNVIRKLPPQWETGFQLSSQLAYFEINLVSSMVNRRKLLQLGLSFNPQMQASEEYNLFMRLLPHGSVYVCKEIIALYRVYGESLTYDKIDRLAIERRTTLAELNSSFPWVADMAEFKLAERQSDYYEACALMNKKDPSNARRIIYKHASSPIFLILYFMAFFPFIWRFCHNPVTKRKLTALLGIH